MVKNGLPKKALSFIIALSMLFSMVTVFADEEILTEDLQQEEFLEVETFSGQNEYGVGEETDGTGENNDESAENSTNDSAMESMDVAANSVGTDEVSLLSTEISIMAAPIIEGDGTSTTPYLITTEEQLLAIATNGYPNSLSSHYQLQNDIVLTTETWTPIGSATAFSGNFDGGGHTVSNLNLTGSGYTYTGFFGQSTGTIKNLNVSVNFEGTGTHIGGIAAYNSGVIENCTSGGEIVHGSTSGSSYAGGLVGRNYNGKIRISGSTATISASNGHVGGLVGENYVYNSEYAIIENSYARGNITGSANTTGGLVGSNSRGNYSNASIIRYCYAVGTINSGTGAGLVGTNGGDDTRIFSSYYRATNIKNTNGFAAPLTSLRTKELFYGWDFENIWSIDSSVNGGYPFINIRGNQAFALMPGYGTAVSPYLIDNEYQLYALSMGVCDMGAYYKLSNSINITARDWMPIGVYYDFVGVFDGNGHTISGIALTNTAYNYVGLFGRNSGTIKNLTVNGAVNGTNHVGLLAGINYNLIENCFSNGEVTNSGSYAGGLVGRNHSGIIKTSGSVATVTVSNGNAGGLVGENYVYNHDYAIIENSYARGNITGPNNTAGGLVGTNSQGNYSTASVIRYCYAVGTINGGTGAGLVGTNGGDGTRIFSSYYRATNLRNTNGFAAPLTSMRTQELYYGWDFENIWSINSSVNGGYPYIDLRGTVGQVYIEGDGIADDPYIIENEYQLFAMIMGDLPIAEKRYYYLANDITITARDWMPIGVYYDFAGVFDGNGHTISGIALTNTAYNYVGLFGRNSGTIKNLTVNGTVNGTNHVGLLTGINYSLIENCFSNGEVTNSGSYAGGLVGRNYNGTIKASGSTAAVTASNGHVGGLVGENYVYNNDYATVENSYARGNITGPSNTTGGLVGTNSQGNYSTAAIIKYCYAVGIINGNAGAGLVGANGGDGTRIFSSYYRATNIRNTNGFSTPIEMMSNKNLYYGWDFEHIWDINPSINDGYPYINLRGKAETIYIEGDGASDDPYMIENEYQLFAMVMGDLPIVGKRHYTLMKNITITARDWMPIGVYFDFEGVFDGNGHAISGIALTNTAYNYVGLFGRNSGTIKNLTVNGTVNGTNHVGLLAGINYNLIENCFSNGEVTNSGSYAGGLVGRNYNGTIKISGSTAAVTASNGNVGGLVGENYVYNNDYATVENSYARGNITGPSNTTGGLVGTNSRGNYSTAAIIKYCYATGVINNAFGSGGGLAGTSSGGENTPVIASYYNLTKSGCTDTTKGTPLTDADMKSSSSYAGWNFTDIWALNSGINDGYPYLQSNIPSVVIETVATPIASPSGGTIASGTAITLSCFTNGATVRYTTDGTEPTSSSTAYSAPITITSTTTIKAKAFKEGMNASDIATFSYTVVQEKIDNVTANPSSGAVTKGTAITLSCATGWATIRYTIDGSEPTALSAVYTEPIAITVATTIKAKAFKEGMIDSDTATFSYTVVLDKIANVTANPSSGIVASGTMVELGCVTGGVTIRYTLDGSEPTVSSTVYTTPIEITAATTIKAKAFKDGMVDSDVSTFMYSIPAQEKVSNVTANPLSSAVTSGSSVTLSCATSGAIIRYTTDGSEPTETSTLYASPIVITEAMTVKAKAFKAGLTDSETSTFTYTIVAANAPLVTVGTVSGRPSETVDVPVTISNNPGISLYEFSLEFDNTKLTPVSITPGTDLKYEMMTDLWIPAVNLTSNIQSGMNLEELEDVTALWTNTQAGISGTSDIAMDGLLFTVKFEIKEDAEETTVPLTLLVRDVSKQNLQKVDLAVANGGVNIYHIPPYTPGDVTGDSAVSGMDVLFLAQYVAGWYPVWSSQALPGTVYDDITEEQFRLAADVYLDDSISGIDVLLLAQYVASWPVVIPTTPSQ